MVGANEGGIPAADGRVGVRVVPVKTVATAAFGTASAAVVKQFAVVTKSGGTLITATQLHSVSLAGHRVGGLALYSVAPSAPSIQFQDQFIIQLINALDAKSDPTQVRIEGKAVVVTRGKVAAAGWFEGARAVVVVRQSGTATPEAIAASVIKHAKDL